MNQNVRWLKVTMDNILRMKKFQPAAHLTQRFVHDVCICARRSGLLQKGVEALVPTFEHDPKSLVVRCHVEWPDNVGMGPKMNIK